jgi:putative protease
VAAREGSPLVAEWTVAGASARVESEALLAPARGQGLSPEQLREQFGRLGNTPYELASLEAEIEGAPFAPVSLLNRLRRDAVERLQALQGAPRAVEIRPQPMRRAAPNQGESDPPSLHLLVRAPEQLEAAIEFRPASITLDYLDLYGLRPSLERIRAAGLQPRVAAPRVLKPGEERIADFLVSCECPILVRSAGLLHSLAGRSGREIVGDFSLNAANSLTAWGLFALGLAALTPAHDLNAAQVAELARSAGAGRIEAVAYQHLPVFHTEHCVFCRFLSTGTSYRDCGRPCERHRLALRDVAGREHPVIADVGCRNTVFGAEAQSATAHLDEWRAAGIARFRLEFVHESAAQVTAVARAFADALAGRIGSAELARRLRGAAPEGVTEGSLYVPQNYRELPVLQ